MSTETTSPTGREAGGGSAGRTGPGTARSTAASKPRTGRGSGFTIGGRKLPPPPPLGKERVRRLPPSPRGDKRSGDARADAADSGPHPRHLGAALPVPH